MTSNLGSEYILDGNNDRVLPELRKHFRPEFINRIDEVVIFNQLNKESIYKILDKIISEIEIRLKNDNIHIRLTDKAKDRLVEQGYEPAYGARPLKRLVSRTIETQLAKEIISGNIKYGSDVIIDYDNNDYNIDIQNKNEKEN
jgi:ATP-dependent Clp protease ATP-binding subunit ClpA